MKYIKENFDKFVEGEKMMEYFKSLIGKFIVFTYWDNLWIGTITYVYYKEQEYFAKGRTYDDDNVFPRDLEIKESEYTTFASGVLANFNIKSIFDNFQDAVNEYEMLKNANKYNL